MAPHTLYFTPGACSLSPRIALRVAGLRFGIEGRSAVTVALAAEGIAP